MEKQLEPFLQNQKTPEEWKKYRETLIGLTDVTHSHFDKLVQVSHTSTHVLHVLAAHLVSVQEVCWLWGGLSKHLSLQQGIGRYTYIE